ncbi:MAG: DUF4330 domain-containing protein [Cyanobacteria bacterium P01_C01_bin.121]
MVILDSKGRLFGKLSLLDLGAALAILMVIFGIFFYPGASGSVAQPGAQVKEIEVDVMTRGLTVLNPEDFLARLAETESTNIIVRNQPYGQIGVKNVVSLPRSVAVPQPDGTVKSYPDPRPELGYTVDMLITLGGQATITDNSPVLGVPVKIGTPIEIDGPQYNFRVSTVAVRILDDEATDSPAADESPADESPAVE